MNTSSPTEEFKKILRRAENKITLQIGFALFSLLNLLRVPQTLVRNIISQYTCDQGYVVLADADNAYSSLTLQWF